VGPKTQLIMGSYNAHLETQNSAPQTRSLTCLLTSLVTSWTFFLMIITSACFMISTLPFINSYNMTVNTTIT